MDITHAARARLSDGLRFAFPTHCCANCGRIPGIRIVDQDTKVTTFLLFGGSELTFLLALPFCQQCLPSSIRRPLSLANKLLIGLLVSAAIATVLLIFLVESAVQPEWVAQHPILTALVLGLSATGLFYSRQRVHRPQTSYYQPVRILQLKRTFLNGLVQKTTFGFTNREYRIAFSVLNNSAIDAGLVKALDV